MSLELTRHGYDVTGVDVSRASVEVARQMAAEDPFPGSLGPPNIKVADIIAWETDRKFNNICFFGALHHFPDPGATLDIVSSFLAVDGRIVVIEPTQDSLTPRDATVIALIRLLLASASNSHEDLELPRDMEDLDAYVQECLREYSEARDHDEGHVIPTTMHLAAMT